MSRSAERHRSEPAGAAPSEKERPRLYRRMVKAMGLDPAAVEHDHPEVMRSVAAACLLCSAVERCVRSLDDGVAGAECDAFCLNAPLLRAVAEYDSAVNGLRV